MKHEWETTKVLFPLQAWGKAVCHPLLCGEFLIINDKIIPLQHQLLDMDRQRPDRQIGLHTNGKIVIPLYHLAHTSVCGHLFISPHLLNKTPWMKHSLTWITNMFVPFTNMYTTHRKKCWWQQLHLLPCSWCHFFPINVLLEPSKISVSPAIMPKPSGLAFISAAAVSAKTSTAALSCQLPQRTIAFGCINSAQHSAVHC